MRRCVAACLAPVAVALVLGACAGPAAVIPGGAALSAPPSPYPPTLPAPTPSADAGPLTKPDLSCIKPIAPMSPMPAPGDMPQGSTMHEIQKRGYLIAGVDQDSYDFGFPNPAPDPAPGQEFQGFDIDILHAISQAVFGSPDMIHYVPVSQDYRLGAANLTITCSRALQVAYSADYFDANQELLVDRDNTSASVTLSASGVPRINGLAGKKVCTVGTTTSIGNLSALQNQGGFGIVLAGNWSDCLLMLQQGTVAAVTTDNTILDGMKAEDPDLKIVGAYFSYEPHGLAFPQEVGGADSAPNTQFISFVNGVLAELESRDRNAIVCPQQLQSTDASCWAALYRVWIGPQNTPRAGNATPSPPSLTSYP
jgi:polar amino acid transport system substrate-binding protein